MLTDHVEIDFREVGKEVDTLLSVRQDHNGEISLGVFEYGTLNADKIFVNLTKEQIKCLANLLNKMVDGELC